MNYGLTITVIYRYFCYECRFSSFFLLYTNIRLYFLQWFSSLFIVIPIFNCVFQNSIFICRDPRLWNFTTLLKRTDTFTFPEIGPRSSILILYMQLIYFKGLSNKINKNCIRKLLVENEVTCKEDSINVQNKVFKFILF